MTEYISREDATKIILEYVTRQERIGRYAVTIHELKQNTADMLDELPPADVAPVVRCKDCKHYYFADNRIPQEQRYVCEISGEIWRPDSFCSYGERREE